MLGSSSNVRLVLPTALSLRLIQTICSLPQLADRRLAQQTRLLKERNQALLRAVGSGKGNNNLSASTTSNSGANECVSCFLHLSSSAFIHISSPPPI